MQRVLVSDLTPSDTGGYYDYEYTVDQGKGEITLIRQGQLKIRSLEFHDDGSVSIHHPTGYQTFSEDTEILLYTDHLPTGND